MSTPLISFIIPAYNAASYLKACIDSVYAVDMKGHEREVIIVNDGSTDNTSEVLSQCLSEHNGLRILTHNNQGLSLARNNGMAIANGRYICFVDADDTVNANCDTAAVISAMQQPSTDIIGIDCRQTTDGGAPRPYRRYVPIYNKVYRPAREFMRGKNLMPCAWAYIYRRRFLEDKQLHFLPHTLHEDEDFTPRVFALADSFVAVRADWYTRIVRKESLTTTTDNERQRQMLRDMVRILASLDAFATEDTERKACMERKLDYLAVDTLRLLLRQRHGATFRKEITAALKAINRYPLRWRWECKYILFNLLTRLML